MNEDKILMTARYVEGDLNEQELADYEMQLKSDEELQTHLQDYNQIHQSLKMHLGDDTAFLSVLAKNNRQFFNENEEAKGFKLHPVLKWASGVAAVLFIGIFIWAPWRNNLYNQYAGEQQMFVTERGVETTELDKAASLFNAKKFTEANAVFAKLYEKTPNDAMIGFYYGRSLVSVNEMQKGREILTKIHQGESVYKYDATFAIALSFIKEKNNTEAQNWLRTIPSNASQYQKANELLNKLN